MLLSTGIACTFAFWATFHILFNFLLETKSVGKRVRKFCNKHNIQVSFLHIRYFTTRLNRSLHKLVTYCRFVRIWFNVGVVLCLFLMFVSVFFLLYNLMWAYREFSAPKVQGQPSQQVLRVMVPGVNFPINQVGFLFIATLLSGFFHELGHAIAAVKEGVGMNGFGMFIFYIYPGAFVDLDNSLNDISPRRRLRVYCAGVWNNCVLSIIACIFIILLPQLLFPFYSLEHDKVIVQSQSKNSPLAVDAGILTGDVITSIDGCSTNGFDRWYYCINETIFQPQAGSCLNERAVSILSHREPDIDPEKCCENAPEKSICYKQVDPDKSDQPLYSCMNARTVMSNWVCHHNSQCQNDEVCVKPYQNDGQRLMRITVERDEILHTIIYLGLPHDLYYFITITQYQPRFKWFFSYTFPLHLLQQLQFFFQISTALGLLNIIPCYFLDGQHAFVSFFDEFFGEHHPHKPIICQIVLTLGTFLVAANAVSGLVHAFR